MNSFFEEQFIVRKLKSPAGYLILSLLALVTTLVVSRLDYPDNLVALVLMIGLLILLISITNPKYGFFLNLLFAFFLRFFLKFNETLPFGIITNIFPVLIFFTIILQKLRTGQLQWTNYKNPITYAFFFYLVYYFLEVLNPEAHSVLGWAQALREVATSLLLYFVTLELCTDKRFLRQFILFWLVCSVILGLYGVYQEFFGFLPFEVRWIYSNENRLSLILVDGVFRKFSAYTSPTTFGIGMAMSAIFTAVLYGQPRTALKKVAMGFGIVVMLLGMAFSGTRTADVMIPVALVLFLVLHLTDVKTVFISLVPIITFVLLLILPIYGNYTLNRFRTAFVGSKDISFNVREINRKSIQPYIYQHPIGGGIMTTGGDGLRFNPSHPLAGFPTDSGYLKTALEQGYIGLLITCLIYWIVLRQALRIYFTLGDQELKWYAMGVLLVVFALVVANFSQDSIAEIPNAQLFYILAGCLVKLPELDRQAMQSPITP